MRASANRSGTASGVLMTSRQVGGAIAIAAFGALLVSEGFIRGMRISLIIAAALLVITMLGSFRLCTARNETTITS